MSNPYAQAPANPVAVPKKKSNTLLIVAIVLGVLFVVMLFCGGILAALLLPAIQQARIAAQRMTFSNDMRQVGLALLNYETTYRSLPPAYTVDENGNKLHSWRTLILPFMEEQALFNSIDFSKPWDAPENAAARKALVLAYQFKSGKLQPGHTLIQAVVHPSGVFAGEKGVTYAQIVDGTSNTLLIAEAGLDHSVHWMDPNDMELDYFVNIPPEARAFRHGGNVVYADCQIRFIANESATPQDLNALVTKGGGEPTPLFP